MVATVYNYLRLGRPFYVLPVMATAVAGYCSASGCHMFSVDSGILGLVFALLGMACWSANGLTDRHADVRGTARNRWGLYVSGGTAHLFARILSVEATVVYVASLAAAGLIVAARFGPACWALSALFLLIGMAYSLKPIRLKQRGVFGLVLVAIAYGIVAFTAGWCASGRCPTRGSLLFATIVSLAFFGFEGIPHLLDYDQDTRNGEKTIAVALGCKTTRHVLAICQSLPVAALLILSLSSRTILPPMNIGLFVPVIVASTLTATMLIRHHAASSLEAVRLFSVPLMSAFVFLAV